MLHIEQFDIDTFSTSYNSESRLRPGYWEYLWIDIPLDDWRKFIARYGEHEAPHAFLPEFEGGKYQNCVYSLGDIKDDFDVDNLIRDDWNDLDNVIEFYMSESL
jgi:hypothetical protein